MQFSWLKSFWKGVQAVLEFALAAALVAGVDAIVNQVDTAEELGQLGVPAALVGAVLLGVRMFVNYWKVKRASLVK